MSESKVVICPYCGETQPAGDRCRACAGQFEPLSRQATHNAMGPWFVRDMRRPFQPGCSYETLVRLIERGTVNKYSIIRGPTTRQFWTIARRVPGVAHRLACCHNCDASVHPTDHGCHACGVPFGSYLDRNILGLPEVRPLPWDAGAEEVPREANSSRPFAAVRAPGAGAGLSSFASDDELLGDGWGRSTAAPVDVAAPRFSDSHAAGAAAPVASVAAAPSPAPSLAALHRRLAGQQRTIRTLAAVAGLLAIVAIILLIASVPRWATDAPRPHPSGASPLADAREAAPPRPSESEPAVAAADPPPAELSMPAAPPTAEPEAYRRALELIREAEDASQPVPERIARYRQAIDALEAIRSAGSASELPPDLDARLAESRRSLERLELGEFFP